jgi:hypothetical protein
VIGHLTTYSPRDVRWRVPSTRDRLVLLTAGCRCVWHVCGTANRQVRLVPVPVRTRRHPEGHPLAVGHPGLSWPMASGCPHPSQALTVAVVAPAGPSPSLRPRRRPREVLLPAAEDGQGLDGIELFGATVVRPGTAPAACRRAPAAGTGRRPARPRAPAGRSRPGGTARSPGRIAITSAVSRSRVAISRYSALAGSITSHGIPAPVADSSRCRTVWDLPEPVAPHTNTCRFSDDAGTVRSPHEMRFQSSTAPRCTAPAPVAGGAVPGVLQRPAGASPVPGGVEGIASSRHAVGELEHFSSVKISALAPRCLASTPARQALPGPATRPEPVP